MNTDIVEGNKLIAEFMEVKITPEVKSEFVIQKEVWSFPDGTTVYGGVSYHANWSLLMPVVEKINKTEATTYSTFKFCIYPHSCSIHFDGVISGFDGLSNGYHENIIDAVYDIAVKFITWHNNQTKQS